MKKVCLGIAAAGLLLLTAGCFSGPEALEIGGRAEGKAAAALLVDIQFRDTIAPPAPEGRFTYATCGGKDAMFMDLVMDVTNKKDKEAELSKLVKISVEADGKKSRRSFGKVETDDGSDFRSEVLAPGETARVQYGVEVLKNSEQYQISLSIGMERYVMKFNRGEELPGRKTAVLGEAFSVGGLELKLDRVRFKEEIETGKYADAAGPVVEYKVYRPEADSSVFLDFSGTVENRGGETLKLSQRDCRVFATARTGETFDAFLITDRGMDDEGTIAVEPGESLELHAAAEIPKELKEELEAAVYRDRQYYHFGSRALAEAPDYSEQLPDRQEAVEAGEADGRIYTNRVLGFSMAFPEDWTLYSPEETLRLMEEESPEKARVEQEEWDIGYLALTRSQKMAGEAAAAEVLIQTMPAEALSGRTPGEYLEERFSGAFSGLGEGASVTLDEGSFQTVEKNGREAAFAAGNASYTEEIYPFNQVEARVACLLFAYRDRAVLARLIALDGEEFTKGEAALKAVTFSQ